MYVDNYTSTIHNGKMGEKGAASCEHIDIIKSLRKLDISERNMSESLKINGSGKRDLNFASTDIQSFQFPVAKDRKWDHIFLFGSEVELKMFDVGFDQVM